MEEIREAGTSSWRRGAWPLLGAVLLVQLALKLALLGQYAAEDPFFGHAFADSAVYDAWSDRILAGEPYPQRAYYQAPGYPFLLAGLKLVTGGSRGGVLLLQLLAGSAALALLFLAGRRLSGDRAGLLAAVLAGFHAPLVFHELKLLPAVWVLLGDAASLLLLLRALERPSAGRALLAGLSGGLLVVLYPARLLLLPVALAWLLLRPRSVPARRRALLGLVALGGALAAILPVTLRNRAAGGGLVLVSSSAGDTLLQGNNRLATGSLAGTPELPADISRQEEASLAAAAKALGRPATSAEASRHSTRLVLGWAASEPWAFARLLSKKALLSLSGLDYADNASFTFERERFLPLLHLFASPWALLLGLLAAAVVLPGRREGLGPALWLFLANQAVCVAFYYSTRYRLPSVPWAALGGALLLASPPGREALRTASARVRLGATLLLLAALLAWEARVSPTIPTDAFRAAAADGFAVAGRYAEARRYMEEAVAADPAPRRLFKLAQLAWLDGDSAAAGEALRRRLAASPADLDALDLLGRIRWGEGRLPEAEEALRRAVALAPDSRFHRVKLAEAVARQGRTDEALALLDEALARWPLDAEAAALRTALAPPGAPRPAPGSPPGSTPAR